MTKDVDDHSKFGADGPVFHVSSEGLLGLVDGEDCFDVKAEDVDFEGQASPEQEDRLDGP